jgi:hypothetical protein
MGKRGATLRPVEAPAIWSCNPRERYAMEEKSPRSAGLPVPAPVTAVSGEGARSANGPRIPPF